jgi:PIN domain nuclease of toxin-antitoxin system
MMSFLVVNNFLVDTHILLWLFFYPEKLNKCMLKTLEDPNHKISVSSISFWEISLKYRLGKLSLNGVLPNELPSLATQMGLHIANITADEFSSFYQLPLITEHKDPFDRMIIWQCISQKMVFVSHDAKLEEYTHLGLQFLKTE